MGVILCPQTNMTPLLFCCYCIFPSYTIGLYLIVRGEMPELGISQRSGEGVRPIIEWEEKAEEREGDQAFHTFIRRDHSESEP